VVANELLGRCDAMFRPGMPVIPLDHVGKTGASAPPIAAMRVDQQQRAPEHARLALQYALERAPVIVVVNAEGGCDEQGRSVRAKFYIGHLRQKGPPGAVRRIER